jgi:hypothetical protein
MKLARPAESFWTIPSLHNVAALEELCSMRDNSGLIAFESFFLATGCDCFTVIWLSKFFRLSISFTLKEVLTQRSLTHELYTR